jgi:Icc-related predicted phosphoesterase
MSRMTIYYASDIHGSEKCWRKFLNAGPFYRADVLIMGGDLTGKGIVPIVMQPNGGWQSTFLGRRVAGHSVDELAQFESDIRFNGMYPYRCQPDELEAVAADPAQQVALFDHLMEQTFAGWLEIAEEKLSRSGLPCYVMPGNDDAWVIDRTFQPEGRVRNCDDQVIDLGDGYTLLSLGYSNPTPWDSPREMPEEQLAARIDALAVRVPDMGRSIFNLHVPPYGSDLDSAPLLDSELRPQQSGGQPIMVPVGSTAVRAAVERYQPLLGLHGHIHESKGTKKIGRTLCLNPGSSYNSGVIDGVLVVLENGKVKRWQFVTG